MPWKSVIPKFSAVGWAHTAAHQQKACTWLWAVLASAVLTTVEANQSHSLSKWTVRNPVPVSFYQLDTNGVAWEEEMSTEEFLLLGWPVGHFLESWFVWEGPVHYGQCQPWAGGCRLDKSASWASHEGRASKHPSSTAPFSLLYMMDRYLDVWARQTPSFSKFILVSVLLQQQTVKKDILLDKGIESPPWAMEETSAPVWRLRNAISLQFRASWCLFCCCDLGEEGFILAHIFRSQPVIISAETQRQELSVVTSHLKWTDTCVHASTHLYSPGNELPFQAGFSHTN